MTPPTRLGSTAAALRLGWQASPLGVSGQLALALLSGLAPTATAYLGRLLVDGLAGHTASASRITFLAAAVAALGGLTAVLTSLSVLAAADMGRAVNLAAQDRLYRRINDFRSLRPFEDPATQDTIRLAEQAAQDAPRQVLDFTLTGARSAVTVASFLSTMLAMWPPMGLLLAATVTVTAIGQLKLARRQAETTKAMMATVRRRFFYRTLLTDRRAAMEIRLFGIGPLLHRRAQESLRESSDADIAVARRNAAVQSVLAVLAAAVTAVAAVAVARQVAHGRITLGEMTLFTAAVTAVQGALSAVLTQLGRTDEALQRFGHYLTLLEAPVDLPDGDRVPAPLREGITFEDVWFRYGPESPWVLKGLDLVLPHGRAVGLVGVNGAGKSTMVKLLCRFYDPERGRILMDGVDIRTVPVAELRRRIGATFQDYMTYDMSARDNIGVGEPDRMGDLARIRAAAESADIDQALSGLPRGYDTMLSRIFLDVQQEKGALLSGGQWQRVALARSLVRSDAELLILDEPSSGLDPIAERRVHQTLTAHRAGRTSLLVSHRLSALREADVIVVLADGRIAEQGRHHELISLGGQYAQLFTAQAEGYQAEGYQYAATAASAADRDERQRT
ncbi:ABC transporter ATP-binding protein/permease [Kitasatospora sp. NBC_01287]|uniref:ABC transporter ATP-binding protein n=1 Tax=Kitasatospora sp. NBC_01287 TaxID=2903573 RepID=UPI0022586A44|nr:ABC transporter ATP-binding protein [Kitasatospora sp. NBC_01287]MCX4750514.1 ABC transporter ATP-binding protein/permease [Kitasatospora sp. NBC_01287]